MTQECKVFKKWHDTWNQLGLINRKKRVKKRFIQNNCDYLPNSRILMNLDQSARQKYSDFSHLNLIENIDSNLEVL